MKFTLTLSQRDAGIVDAISAERGVTKPEVIRAAIATEKYFRDTVARGEKILIQGANGTLRELMFRW